MAVRFRLVKVHQQKSKANAGCFRLFAFLFPPGTTKAPRTVRDEKRNKKWPVGQAVKAIAFMVVVGVRKIYDFL